MKVSFSPETNFKYPNNNTHYKRIRCFKKTKCCGNDYFISFHFIDWRNKRVKHELFKCKNKKTYLNYKNKLLALV